MAQTHRQTNGHGNSVTESAQWADSVKIKSKGDIPKFTKRASVAIIPKKGSKLQLKIKGYFFLSAPLRVFI